MSNFRPITDTWILARPKVKFYGAYPSGFLERARNLLGVSLGEPVLHVCSGQVRSYPFRGLGSADKTLDLAGADYNGDVNQGVLPIAGNGWKGILADPPYTPADALKSGTVACPSSTMLLRSCLEVVSPGGRVGILCYEWPRPPKSARSVAVVGVLVGFGNRMRCFSVFERGPA